MDDPQHVNKDLLTQYKEPQFKEQYMELTFILLWQPLVTKTNRNTNNKSLSRISSGNHKRT